MFFGMLGITGFGLFFTPTFHTVERCRQPPHAAPPQAGAVDAKLKA
jgi:hypothetical protein